jgi:hypothetical protein
MWSNAKNGLVPTPIREGTSPSYLPRKCKLSRAFAGKQKKNGNRTIPVFLIYKKIFTNAYIYGKM